MFNKKDMTTIECPFCERIISSPSRKQAEFNYQLHHDSCKQRNILIKKKEVKNGKTR